MGLPHTPYLVTLVCVELALNLWCGLLSVGYL